MCGRFTLTASPEEVEREFDLEGTPDLEPRFNVAPGQWIPTITAGADGHRALAMRRWGLVPGWAKDEKIGSRLINARSETAAEKPSFRAAMRRRRCLVPMDGFYEWAKGGAGPKRPHWIHRPEGGCFAVAGLWERWKAPGDAWLETCTLLTGPANRALSAVHDRMPVVVPAAERDRWLDPGNTDPATLLDLLAPAPEDVLVLRPVSRKVNRPEHDAPDCIEPATDPVPAADAVNVEMEF
jgi:putative SOS response-associated peptidase YedK